MRKNLHLKCAFIQAIHSIWSFWMRMHAVTPDASCKCCVHTSGHRQHPGQGQHNKPNAKQCEICCICCANLSLSLSRWYSLLIVLLLMSRMFANMRKVHPCLGSCKRPQQAGNCVRLMHKDFINDMLLSCEKGLHNCTNWQRPCKAEEYACVCAVWEFRSKFRYICMHRGHW